VEREHVAALTARRRGVASAAASHNDARWTLGSPAGVVFEFGLHWAGLPTAGEVTQVSAADRRVPQVARL
jgi:hypothetical protein